MSRGFDSNKFVEIPWTARHDSPKAADPLTFQDILDGERGWLYLLRLTAFAPILVSLGARKSPQK